MNSSNFLIGCPLTLSWSRYNVSEENGSGIRAPAGLSDTNSRGPHYSSCLVGRKRSRILRQKMGGGRLLKNHWPPHHSVRRCQPCISSVVHTQSNGTCVIE